MIKKQANVDHMSNKLANIMYHAKAPHVQGADYQNGADYQEKEEEDKEAKEKSPESEGQNGGQQGKAYGPPQLQGKADMRNPEARKGQGKQRPSKNDSTEESAKKSKNIAEELEPESGAAKFIGFLPPQAQLTSKFYRCSILRYWKL